MTNLPPSPYGSADDGRPTQQPPYAASQQPHDASYFYPPEQTHYGYAPVGPTPPQKRGNGPGLASLIVGLVSIGVAFIPVVNFLSFVLGVVGVVLGVVGLVLADRPRAQAIWGTVLSFVSLILAAIMVVAYTFGFIFAIGDAVDTPDRDLPSVTAIPDPPFPGDPLTLGTAVEFVDSNGDPIYAATVTAYDLDATDQVLAVEGNSAPPAGMEWAMVTVAAAPLTAGSTDPGGEIVVEYVAANGSDLYGALDGLAVAPDPDFSQLTDVAVNETVIGNVVIPIPSDDSGDGLWSIRYSGPAGTDGPYFFEAD